MKSWILTHYTRITIAFTITVVLIAVFVGAWVLRQRLINNVYNTRSEWSTVSGTILFTEKLPYNDSDYIAIKFEYVVDGVTYQNNQQWEIGSYKKERSRYPPGNSITVHYNSVEPGSGLIDIDESYPWWELVLRFFIVWGGFGALLIVIFIWGLWVRGKKAIN